MGGGPLDPNGGVGIPPSPAGGVHANMMGPSSQYSTSPGHLMSNGKSSMFIVAIIYPFCILFIHLIY